MSRAQYFSARLVHDLKKTVTSKTKNDIQERTRELLGKSIRGEYFQQYTQQSNVVVLNPEIQKAFPRSETANKALANMLIFSIEAEALVVSKSERPLSAAQRSD